MMIRIFRHDETKISKGYTYPRILKFRKGGLEIFFWEELTLINVRRRSEEMHILKFAFLNVCVR